MRHRASRPLADLWHRLPRATARRLGQAAEAGPVRMLAALTVMLSLGAGGFLAIGPELGMSSAGPAESVRAASGDEAEDPVGQAAPQPGQSPDGNSPESDEGSPDSSPPPTVDLLSPLEGSDATPSLRTRAGEVTGTPSTPAEPGSTSPAESPSQDTTPPETSLSEEYPESDAAVFSFSANEAASFSCSLDGSAFSACDSPTRYSDLDPGWHTFEVRAVDAAGNVDPSPAGTRWLARDGHSEDQ